jgi:hypothetical protein
MGKPIPIKLPPGIFRNGTHYEAAGRWFDGNLIRWENGRLKPIGGWQAMSATALTGIARGGLAFTSDLGFNYILIGTHSNLYVAEDDKFVDLTPPDFISGRPDSILGAGYGAGPYGVGTYGTPRDVATLSLLATTWQFDTFGNTAVMVSTSDRKIRQFDPSLNTIVVPSGSPTCAAVFTTNEDFLLAIGANGIVRNVAWADVGTTTIWTPTDLNAAGDINLVTNGLGVAGTRVGLVNLVWTTVDVHTVNFVGQPAIYAPVRIGTGCGLIGPKAWAVAASGASAGETAYWMSPGGFFQYSGAVTPLPCEVQDYLWKNINFTESAKISCGVNSRFHEVIWFFPSLGSLEIDSYAIFNYKDNIWYFGIQSLLARTTWIDQRPLQLPIGVGPDGIVYEHETGYLANGLTRLGQVWASTGAAEVGDGETIVYSNMMQMDGDNLVASDGTAVLTMQLTMQMNPQKVIGHVVVPLVPNKEGYTPLRFVGRQVSFRLDILKDQDWALGKLKFDMASGGKR